MTLISDLPHDLTEEILSRVPIISRGTVRSTCKGWNVVANDQSFMKKHCVKAAAKELLVIMIYGYRLCLTNINFHNHKGLLKQSSIWKIGKFSQVKISQVFHCNGLLLGVTRDKTKRLMVWNPYLGQVWWTQPLNIFRLKDTYALGYDNNNKHKILKLCHEESNNQMVKCELYDFKSSSWKVLTDTLNWYIGDRYRKGISLKGNNTYFVAQEGMGEYEDKFLLCFDFTRERFGPRLHLPFGIKRSVILSSVREEQLAVLFDSVGTYDEIEIWITTKIEPDELSWRTFLKFDLKPFDIRPLWFQQGTFFVDEEKKLALNYIEEVSESHSKPYVIGEDGYYKELNLEKSEKWPYGCSYVPSLAQIDR